MGASPATPRTHCPSSPKCAHNHPLSFLLPGHRANQIPFNFQGYIKSTIHRVVRPPPDQSALHRLGLLYFVRPGDDVDMVPAPSPVLCREGLLSESKEGKDGTDTATEPVEPVKGLGEPRASVNSSLSVMLIVFCRVCAREGEECARPQGNKG